MSVNFGTLDYYGHVPAKELKETIRLIAYDGIKQKLIGPDAASVVLVEHLIGIIRMTEALCDQIDAEVASNKADVQQILQKYAEGKKNEPAT